MGVYFGAVCHGYALNFHFVYDWPIRYLWEKKTYLFYLNATAKSEIHVCSNKYETGLVYAVGANNLQVSEMFILIRIKCVTNLF